MELIGAINACSIFIPAKRQTGELEIEVVCKAAKELENEEGGRDERGDEGNLRALRASGVGSLDLDGRPSELWLQVEGGDVMGLVGSLIA